MEKTAISWILGALNKASSRLAVSDWWSDDDEWFHGIDDDDDDNDDDNDNDDDDNDDDNNDNDNDNDEDSYNIYLECHYNLIKYTYILIV